MNSEEIYQKCLRKYISLLNDGCQIDIYLKKLKSHPFCRGNILVLGMELMVGTFENKRLPHLYQEIVENFENALSTSDRNHLKALLFMAKYDFENAIKCWKAIIITNLDDILALKFAHDVSFYLGSFDAILDLYPLVLRKLDATNFFYSYILAMYAFAKVETFSLEDAEYLSINCLKMNPQNAWATHSLVHVYSMTDRHDKALFFLETTKTDWGQSDFLACHIYWHLALLYLEKGDVAKAYDVFSTQIKCRALDSLSLFHFVDAVSILYRLCAYQSMIDDCNNMPLYAPYLCNYKSAYMVDWITLTRDVASTFVEKFHVWPFNVAHIQLTLSVTMFEIMKFMDNNPLQNEKFCEVKSLDGAMCQTHCEDCKECAQSKNVHGHPSELNLNYLDKYDGDDLNLKEILTHVQYLQKRFNVHLEKNLRNNSTTSYGVLCQNLEVLCNFISQLFCAHKMQEPNLTIESAQQFFELANTPSYPMCTIDINNNDVVHTNKDKIINAKNFCWLGGSFPQRELFTLICYQYMKQAMKLYYPANANDTYEWNNLKCNFDLMGNHLKMPNHNFLWSTRDFSNT